MKIILVLTFSFLFLFQPYIHAQGKSTQISIKQWSNPLVYLFWNTGPVRWSEERGSIEPIKTNIFGKEYLVSINYKKYNSINDRNEYSDSLDILFNSVNIELEGIEFINPTNQNDVKKLNEMVEPEVFSKMSSAGFSDWRLIMYLSNSSELVFLKKTFHIGEEFPWKTIYILNLRSGEFISYDVSPFFIQLKTYISLKFGHPIVITDDNTKAQIIDLENNQKKIKILQALRKYQNPGDHYFKIIPSDGSLSGELTYIDYPTESTTQFEIGIVTDKDFEKNITIKKTKENEILFSDKEGFERDLRTAIRNDETKMMDYSGAGVKINFYSSVSGGGVRCNGNLLLISDKFGSIYVYNIEKNGLLERKYGSLQIKNNQLSADDIDYLKQFGTNPFTGYLFDTNIPQELEGNYAFENTKGDKYELKLLKDLEGKWMLQGNKEISLILLGQSLKKRFVWQDKNNAKFQIWISFNSNMKKWLLGTTWAGVEEQEVFTKK